MKYINLLQNCSHFNKVAKSLQKEKKIVLDPKQKNINFWSKFLFNAIKSYALKFYSPKAAKNIFDNIAMYNKAPAYHSNKDVKDIEAIDTAILEATNKLKAAGLNPISVLQQQGMTNINPNILNILHNNLQTIRFGQDFNKYQHYYLQAPGQPKDIIELDEEIDNSAGY